MKPNKLAALYWGSTVFVSLIMAYAGVLFLFRLDGSTKVLQHLGYPLYLSRLIGTTRLVGAVALCLPLPEAVLEWTYAELTFDLVATIYSMLASRLPIGNAVEAGVLLIALQGSYRLKATQRCRDAVR